MSDQSNVKLPNSEQLHNEIIQKHDLKRTQTQEKNILPTKEDLQTEKVVETSEEIVKQIEKNPDLIKKLHHVKVQEKNVLPTKEQIEEEKKLSETGQKE